jgi:hypothetical protein
VSIRIITAAIAPAGVAVIGVVVTAKVAIAVFIVGRHVIIIIVTVRRIGRR